VTSGPSAPLLRGTALGQGVFYLITGLWPLISRRTFEAVTGPKTDFWLVHTAGLLITVVGSALGLAGLRRRVTPEMALLGTGSAAALSAIDVVYVCLGRISRVYLLDAVAEWLLIAGWAVAWLQGRGRDQKTRR
jgi:hypothetical protein